MGEQFVLIADVKTNIMKIKSIKKIENTSKLYDIEVEKTHCFFANGILVHNSSATYSIVNDVFGVSSRNLELLENATNSFWKVARAKKIEYKMRLFMAAHNLESLTLQGELVGEGVQKNKYHLKGQDVRFFRIFDPIKYRFFPYDEFIVSLDEMGLTSVPIIDDDFTLPETVQDIILYADGRSALYETAREGVVFVAKERIDTSARDLENYQGRLSFKVISNKFILKHDA